MPLLNLEAQSHFTGIDTVTAPDDVSDLNTPDSRNDDISEMGVVKTRAGMSKVSSSVLTGGLIYAIAGFVSEDDIEYRLAFHTDGTIVTY